MNRPGFTGVRVHGPAGGRAGAAMLVARSFELVDPFPVLGQFHRLTHLHLDFWEGQVQDGLREAHRRAPALLDEAAADCAGEPAHRDSAHVMVDSWKGGERDRPASYRRETRMLGRATASGRWAWYARGVDRVHYMRVEELSVVAHEQGKPEYNPDQDRMVNPDYVEELIAAASASLTA